MGFSGMDKAKKQLSALEYKTQLMAAKTMQEWLILIGTEAAVMTPIDTSTLLNSQYKSQQSGSESVSGRIGYGVYYASYVHDYPAEPVFSRLSHTTYVVPSNFNISFAQVTIPNYVSKRRGEVHFKRAGAEKGFLIKAITNTEKERLTILNNNIKKL